MTSYLVLPTSIPPYIALNGFPTSLHGLVNFSGNRRASPYFRISQYGGWACS